MSTATQFANLAKFVVATYQGRDNSFPQRVQFWIDCFGDKDISALCTDDIEDGIDILADRDKTLVRVEFVDGVRRIKHVPVPGQKLSPSSINRYIASLGTVFKTLRQKRKLPRGFTSPLRGVTRQTEGAGRTLTVSLEDVKRLVACCRVSRNRKLAAQVAFAATVGWRKSNVQNLRWGDLDLNAGIVDTSRTKNGTAHRGILLPWVIEELSYIKPERAESGDLVFGKADITKAFKNALKLADLPEEWTFHHLRHVAASILAQSGASTVTIMQALNHKSPMMAMRYSHLNTTALRDSMMNAWGAAA